MTTTNDPMTRTPHPDNERSFSDQFNDLPLWTRCIAIVVGAEARIRDLQRFRKVLVNQHLENRAEIDKLIENLEGQIQDCIEGAKK